MKLKFFLCRNKKYIVKCNSERNEIIANDNGSYWSDYLGYPSIAFLMLKGIIKYNKKFAEALSGISWKDINTKFKNDYKKTEKYILEILKNKNLEIDKFLKEIDNIYEQIKKLNLNVFEKKIKPPEGY